jgi:hypothetical protein
MTTKIFISQIDTTQPDGSTASPNSILYLTSDGPLWKPVAELSSVGYVGSSGTKGYDGSVGYKGSQGENGMPGTAGYQGSAGYRGSAGVGYTGSVGYTSSIGYTSSVGYQGSQGDTGYFGSLGYTGYFGSTGYRGSEGTGFFGSTGYRGSSGETARLDPFPFLNLSDVAYDTYNDYAGAFVRVNNARDGLELSMISVLTNSINVNVDMNGYSLSEPVFSGYSESVKEVGSSAAEVYYNAISDGNVITLTLVMPITDIHLTNNNLISGRLYSMTFIIKQDSVGGRMIDWTNNIMYWSTGDGINQTDGPNLSLSPFYTDIITVYTVDGGNSWYGVMGARGFPTP